MFKETARVLADDDHPLQPTAVHQSTFPFSVSLGPPTAIMLGRELYRIKALKLELGLALALPLSIIHLFCR